LDRKIPVIPIQSTAYESKARRPAFSLLNSDSTREAIGLRAEYWRNNLRNMLDELRAA
jgi:dTDP-4-dehydrorhamnose reductase